MAKKSKIIMIGLIVILVVIGGYFIVRSVTSNNEDKIQSNTNENVIKDQKVGGFQFTNTSLTYENGKSKLTIRVKNITDQDIVLQSFDIIVKDKNGKEMTTLLGYIGDTIKVGETRVITSEENMNLMEAESINYVIHQ